MTQLDGATRFLRSVRRVGDWLSPSRSALVGVSLGQIALLAATPVLTHIADLRTFAFFQLGLAVAIVVQPVATLRLEQVVVVRPLADAMRLVRLGYRAVVATSLAMVMLSLFASLGGWATTATIALSGSGTVAGFAVAVIDNASLVRSGRLRTVGARSALAGVFGGALQILAVLCHGGAIGLGAAILVGRLAATAVTLGGTPALARVERSGSTDRYGWRRAIPSILSLMVSSLALQGPVLVISAAIGAVGGAQVGLAQRVAGVPGSLLAAAISQVVTARLAPPIRAAGRPLPRRLRVEKMVRDTARRLMLVGLALAIVLVLAGPLVTPTVFGPSWRSAGTLIAILALPYGLQLCAFPMVNVYALVGAEALLLKLQFARLAVVLMLTWLACQTFTAVTAICLAAGVAISLSYVGLILGALRAAARFDLGRRRETNSDARTGHDQTVAPPTRRLVASPR